MRLRRHLGRTTPFARALGAAKRVPPSTGAVRTGAADPSHRRNRAPNAHPVDGWQEAQGVDPAVWVPQPATHRASVEGELGAKHRRVGCDSAPVGSALGEDDPSRDRGRIPAPVARDRRRESPTSVGRSHQVVDVDEFRLQLDDEQDSSARVPREDIDDATFSVDREGHLRLGDPAIETGEHGGHRLVHRCVPGVDQATEVAALPSECGVEPGIEGDSDPTNRPERYRIEPAVFDATNDGARHAGSRRQILLAKPLSDSNRPQRCAHPMVVHEPSLRNGPYLRRI
jgi:hypothetical protein